MVIEAVDESARVVGDFAFINSIDTERVFAFCASLRRSESLFTSFGCDCCVEICSLVRFVEDCQQAISGLDGDGKWRLLHRPVHYYKLDAEAGMDVKNPDNLAFFKPEEFAYQEEYRLVIGPEKAFDLRQHIAYGELLHNTERPLGEECRELWLDLERRPDYLRLHRAR